MLIIFCVTYIIHMLHQQIIEDNVEQPQSLAITHLQQIKTAFERGEYSEKLSEKFSEVLNILIISYPNLKITIDNLVLNFNYLNLVKLTSELQKILKFSESRGLEIILIKE